MSLLAPAGCHKPLVGSDERGHEDKCEVFARKGKESGRGCFPKVYDQLSTEVIARGNGLELSRKRAGVESRKQFLSLVIIQQKQVTRGSP